MQFRIADTFTASLARLRNDEQKVVKTTAFDLQIDPANPGMRLHRIDRSKDPNFWSIRVNADIRLIVHKSSSSLLLCYVDHHDKAYRWAERRRLERHPKTGAAQLVEIRERVEEVIIPKHLEVERPAPPKRKLFADIPDEDLLAHGVPNEWLADVKQADEDTLLDVADHLPAEAAEALLEIAVGGTPPAPKKVPETADPFEHPDARRRFRVMENVEELERALDFPWESGRCSCIPCSASWWSATTAVRRAFLDRPARARPSSPCIAPVTSRASIRMPGCCSRHSPTR